MDEHQNVSDSAAKEQRGPGSSKSTMSVQESITCEEHVQNKKLIDSDSDRTEAESSDMDESNGFQKVKIKVNINEEVDTDADESNGFHKVVICGDYSDVPYHRLHEVDEEESFQKIKIETDLGEPVLVENFGELEPDASNVFWGQQTNENISISDMEVDVPYSDGEAADKDIDMPDSCISAAEEDISMHFGSGEANSKDINASYGEEETNDKEINIPNSERQAADKGVGVPFSDEDAKTVRSEKDSVAATSSHVAGPSCEPSMEGSVLRHRIDPEPARSTLESDDLSFRTCEEEITPRGSKEKQKIALIRAALESNPVDVAALRKLAISPGGLVNKNMRQRVWPLLINANTTNITPKPSQEEMEAMTKTYTQVVMDVNRSSSRFPPGIDDHVRMSMKDKLVDLIMRVMIKHQQLKYYQGFHDVCITFLLCMDEDLAFAMVDKLAMGYMREYLDETMERTSLLLNFVYPLVNRCNPELCEHMQKNDLGTIFALSWVITWFSHVLGDIKRILRVFDFFLASHRMMPVYLSAAFVLHREQDIYEAGDEMGYIHKCLSTIPHDLPLESLLQRAGDLYLQYPPAEISQDPMLLCMNRQVHEHFNRIDNRNAARRMVHPTNDVRGQMFVKATLWTVTAVVGLAVAVLYHSYMGEDWSLADIWSLFS